ncbi:MAG: PEGA domain-containing protein [Lachnospiraceae bacterium]|nr:PEGA domain-containing protein [Lachnospiraceae bacterium]
MNRDIRSFCKRIKTVAVLMLLFLCFFASSCVKKADNSSAPVSIEEDYSSREELYIFQSVDHDSNMMRVIHAESGAETVFQYSGRTEILTFEGESTVVDRLQCGDLVRLVYNTKDEILNYVHVARDRWEIETTGQYLTRQSDLGGIKLENTYFKLNNNYVIYSNNTKIDMDEIAEKDRITVRGIGNVAYTITVTSGHGTVRLKNSSAYIGGWIEMGKVISVIKEGMILDVPEGDYNAVLTRHGCKGEMVVSVARDKDVEIDCTKLKETKTGTGIVNFHVTPSDAEIYINGSKLNSTQPVELIYGKYYLAVKAPGYETYGATMLLNSVQADININLTRSNGQSSSSSSSSSKTSTTSTTSSSSSSSSSGTSSSSSTMDSSARQSLINSVEDQMRSLQNSILQNSLLNTNN